MKRKRNILSHVWDILKALGALNSFWEFLRDHYDDIF